MDPRLLRFYNDELGYLREAAREFGEEHETVAGRLGLKTPTDPDPYVERLLEGVAFLGARVQLKMADQYPEFTQHLLHAVQPHFLAPMPSICIAGIEPRDGDQMLLNGLEVPRGTELIANAQDQGGAAVTFRTGHALTLWPLKITEAEYLSSRAAIAGYAEAAGVRAEAGLRLRFEATGGLDLTKVAPKTLPIYLAGSESVPADLYRQFAGETLAVVARNADAAGDSPYFKLPVPGQLGFSDEEALLPAEQRSFRGYRLLAEYFACPERFLFVDLKELSRAFPTCPRACDIVLLFSRSSQVLSGTIGPSNFRLHATPAINLFEKQLDRVLVKPHVHELQVIGDAKRHEHPVVARRHFEQSRAATNHVVVGMRRQTQNRLAARQNRFVVQTIFQIGNRVPFAGFQIGKTRRADIFQIGGAEFAKRLAARKRSRH